MCHRLFYPTNKVSPILETKSETIPDRSTVLVYLTEDIGVKYIFGSVLGRGTFGEVLACMEKKNKHTIYACKLIRPRLLLKTSDGPNVIGRIQNELACLAYLAGHPNIIHLIDVYETKQALYIVQEICQGGNLMQLLEQNPPLSEEIAATFFRAMIKSVLHCHQLGIIHRDIKPDNFLLSKRFNFNKRTNVVLKLADFGLACFHRNENMTEAIGSPYYMSPEMVKHEEYGIKSDLWSCGICLYRMISGYHPFDGKTIEELFSVLIDNPIVDFSNLVWKPISDECKDLICALLNVDQSVRINGYEVLNHPWMLSNQDIKARRASSFKIDCDEKDLHFEKGKAINKVWDKTPSARIFVLHADIEMRSKIHIFVDMFKKSVEEPYVRLLQAVNADIAAAEWDVMCDGLRKMDDYLENCGSHDGYFFLGREPSLAEAAISPSLYRICATLPIIRELDLLKACQDMGVNRLYVWIKELLDRPSDCCDVRSLPQNIYVHLARRLYVKYEGPPTPPSPHVGSSMKLL